MMGTLMWRYQAVCLWEGYLVCMGPVQPKL